ncbi:hypothetical protein TVAG_251780 [Trichomonas vaginalis G3]|uniref:Uncharacterized protein n=1 Tax=Trichomonas vaginalis (strain ATCC PRA-98 / G3) TaxID=412133 RepID=A2EF36_TRIV3|nr:hypothetical protein TVAGG3_0739820 [Trichomonas vaginalis G3]EAY08752.1 hypothetical protein TVAG_251780 [Trichomonas vaginalis G3]KAI5511800.1 hypothetical protein TVAGG3_0739820 [Trichomonas vaginalis G3]|eukprot:XP_001320975.1 hypothetical protein [Trichomonas vaginalis G3]
MSFNIDDLKGDDVFNSFSAEHSVPFSDNSDNEKLRSQLAEYEKFLTMLNVQIEERRQRYDDELAKIKDTIAEHQKKYQFALEEQNQIQITEENQLRYQLEKQYADISTIGTDKGEHLQKWSESHHQIVDLEKQIEISKLKTDIVRTQGTMIANALTTIFQENLSKTEKLNQRRAIKSTLESLEHDVDQYMQDISFQKDKYSSIINEIQNTMKIQDQYFELSKKKISEEISRRDKFFAKHINTIKAAIERENNQIDTEIAIYERKYKSLCEIRRENNRKSTQIISRFNKDIVRLQASLESANSNNDSESTVTFSSLTKSDSIRRNLDYLKSEEARLAAELDSVLSVQDRASAVLHQIMKEESFSYSTVDYDYNPSPFKIPMKYNV